MIDRDVIAFFERDPKQALCNGELGFQHIIERQVCFHGIFVQIVEFGAGFLGIIPPVPGFQIIFNAHFSHDLFDLFGFDF